MRDETLDLSADAGLCRGCGERRGRCAYSQCTTCDYHSGAAPWAAWSYGAPLPLCCGWWGYADALPWRCLTCAKVRPRRHRKESHA